MASETLDDGRHEPPGVATWKVLAASLGFLAFVALAFWGLNAFYHNTVRQAVEPPPQPFPAPQLQSEPRADLEEWRADQRQRLETYAWTDRAHGLVRVPIERAMTLLAARGQAAYDPLEAAPPPAAGTVP